MEIGKIKSFVISSIVLVLAISSVGMAQVCDDTCNCVNSYYGCLNSESEDFCINELLRCLGCDPTPVPEFPTAALPALLAGFGYVALRMKRH